MCCSKGINKLLLFIFNVAFFLFGIAALALGIFLLVDGDLFLDVLGKVPGADSFDPDVVLATTSLLTKGAIMLIVAGVFIFILGACGLCGGIKENSIMLTIYAVLVGIILVIQLAAGVLAYFYGNRVESYLSGWIGTLITDYYSGALMENGTLALSADSTGVSDAIDAAQIHLECCGATNYTDFDTASSWNRSYTFYDSADDAWVTVTDAVVPISCCMMTNPGAWPGSPDTIDFVDLEMCLTTGSDNSTNTVSCFEQVKSLLQEHDKAAIGVGIGIALVEILGVVAAGCLISLLKKEQKVGGV